MITIGKVIPTLVGKEGGHQHGLGRSGCQQLGRDIRRFPEAKDGNGMPRLGTPGGPQGWGHQEVPKAKSGNGTLMVGDTNAGWEEVDVNCWEEVDAKPPSSPQELERRNRSKQR